MILERAFMWSFINILQHKLQRKTTKAIKEEPSRNLSITKFNTSESTDTAKLIDVMNISRLTEEQSSRMLRLNAMYSRQNPAYLAQIQKKQQFVKQISKSMEWNFQQRLYRARYYFRHLQRKPTEEQSNKDMIQYLNQRRELSVKGIKQLNKRLQSYQQQVQVFIYMEWRNLERAKEEDDSLSVELTSITIQEVKEIAGFRYIVFEEVFEKCVKYRQQMEELFAKQSFY